MKPQTSYPLYSIGTVRSTLKERGNAPLQGGEGAPDAWLEIAPGYDRALHGLKVGDELLIFTWLHQGERDCLEVHPRGDRSVPLTGVFATRSPHRPNPIGLHRVTLREIEGLRLRVEPLEAIDGTPVVDIKPVLDETREA
jgi:tRNA-Thr(GGU) m(6)t(6)A37 methyltransferase TsaA